MMTIQEQKRAIRQSLKAKRAAMDLPLKQELDQRLFNRARNLAEIRSASSIFCFVSMPTEVDTHPLLKSLLKMDKKLSTPCITPQKTMVAVELQKWDELVPGELGILTLNSSTPFPDNIEVCLTPGLGFTERGERIGFGRGYYDSWFKTHPETLKIALSYEYQIVDELPIDENDVPMDVIITESRIIHI